MPNYKQKLANATTLLSKYYGLNNLQALNNEQASNALTNTTKQSLNSVIGQTGNSNDTNIIYNDFLISSLLSVMFEVATGAKTSSEIIDAINQLITESEQGQAVTNEIFEIYSDKQKLITGTTTEERPSISELLGYSNGQEETLINSNYIAPSKEKPNLSIVLSNSQRVSLGQRDTNPVVIFLNGIPNIELSRAVPFINIEFLFPRPPIDPASHKLQTPSIYRFILGEQEISDNGVKNTLVSAGQIKEQTASSEVSNYATAGMELFFSPQTMVDADTLDDPELRPTQVLDKFKSFLSLQDFEVTIVPTVGLFSYKSAKLNFILHDRSRLAEIADFIRPDLRSKLELIIEYGWSHPDGDVTVGTDNAYGDLINGMRTKEIYGIKNSSFSFQENGEVSISLELFTKGASAFDTELISSDSKNLGNIIKEIEDLQKTVKEYENRIFPNEQSAKLKEVRGHQILEAAQDSFKFVSTGNKLKASLNNFKKLLGNTTPDTKDLISTIEELIGKNASENKTAGGKVEELRNSIADSIKRKIQNLRLDATPDPFIKPNPQTNDKTKGRAGKRAKKLTGEIKYEQNFGSILNDLQHAGVRTDTQVSLAKLVLAFIGEPLANSNQFDDIQLIFYPFNEYAGYASDLNIGNFSVDLSFFVQEYFRYRLEHVSKSANMTLRSFLEFLAETILDDPSSPSYGLTYKGEALYKRVFNEDGTEARTEIATKNIADFQKRLQTILEGVTPDGSFKQPQIEFFLEACPQAAPNVEGQDITASNGRTILRIHVFDRQSNAFDTLSSLLNFTIDSRLETIGKNVSKLVGGNEAVKKERSAIASKIISDAISLNPPLLEAKKDKDGNIIDPPTYRIKGGIRNIKEFIMKYTPYIIFGSIGSTVKSAQLSTIQDPLLSTVNVLRSFSKTELEPNNESSALGLPMRIVPAQMTATTMGCPLINFAQVYFVDFQTGTTADNFYTITGVSHKFSAGSFTTDIQFGFSDAWGRYYNLINQFDLAKKTLESIENEKRTKDQIDNVL